MTFVKDSTVFAARIKPPFAKLDLYLLVSKLMHSIFEPKSSHGHHMVAHYYKRIFKLFYSVETSIRIRTALINGGDSNRHQNPD